MKDADGDLQLAATDLSNYVACGHLTTLSQKKLRGELAGFTNYDPLLRILQERGRVHEAAYLAYLKGQGLRVVQGGNTLQWMSEGVDVIAQAELLQDRWYGRVDFLRRVERPCEHWAWSYEVIDTKLATETRASTILQLCVYSDLLSQWQRVDPHSMHVVKPGAGFPTESFAFAEYSAIYRSMRADFLRQLDAVVGTYPERTAHCDTCNWSTHCDAQRRADDHLSFVADLGRGHQRELARVGITTLAQLAAAPTPWPHEPERGNRATYNKLSQQARLQQASRGAPCPSYELLSVEDGHGLARLPAPSEGDVFLDFEGDPFIGERGREYLFGWYTHTSGYQYRWAFDDTSERTSLEELIAFVMQQWEAHHDMHIYHFAPYEVTALKRLVGRYARCAEQLDRLLRGKRFIDLYSVTRQSVRVGVESYSIKYLEPLVGFTRPVPLATTGPLVHSVKLALQRGLPDAIEPTWKQAVLDYNYGDCAAAASLRDWLEHRRTDLLGQGVGVARPPLLDGAPERENEIHTRAQALAIRLLDGISPDRLERNDTQQAMWLLGHIMEWYRREAKQAWWEYFRLSETSDDERLDEQKAIAGLELEQRFPPQGRARVPVDRFRFPPQDVQLKVGDELCLDAERDLGTIVAIDEMTRTIDIKRTQATVDDPVSSGFAHKIIGPRDKAEALVRLGEQTADVGFIADSEPSLARDLLFRTPPRVLTAYSRAEGETTSDYAVRLSKLLDGTALPIQGPPGTGKTWTAARMIVELARAGKRVGVTATSHAVISNLIERASRKHASRVFRCELPSNRKAMPSILLKVSSTCAALPRPTSSCTRSSCWVQPRGNGRVRRCRVPLTSCSSTKLVRCASPMRSQSVVQPERWCSSATHNSSSSRSRAHTRMVSPSQRSRT